MIVDLRTYTLRPGGLSPYLDLYVREGFPVHTSHVGPPLGYYATEIGELNQVVHLWGYESLADREQRRAALDADPRWMSYREKMWAAGNVVRQENKILRSLSAFDPKAVDRRICAPGGQGGLVKPRRSCIKYLIYDFWSSPQRVQPERSASSREGRTSMFSSRKSIGFAAALAAAMALSASVASAQETKLNWVDGVLQPLDDGFPSDALTIIVVDDPGTTDSIYATALVKAAEGKSPVPIKIDHRPEFSTWSTWEAQNWLITQGEAGNDGSQMIVPTSPAVPAPGRTPPCNGTWTSSIAGMLGSTIILSATGWHLGLIMLRFVNINRSMVIVLSIATVLIGVYSLSSRIFDVYVVLACGVLGYYMLRYGYSTAAAALAVVLGRQLERSLRLGLNLTDGDWIEFLSGPTRRSSSSSPSPSWRSASIGRCG